MSRKTLSVGVALILTLALAGAAAAAVPMVAEGSAHGFGKAMGGMIFRVADFLGVDIATVQEARAEGETLADILGDKTEAFIAATVSQRQEFLAQLVKSGKISPEQAAFCEEQIETRLTERLNSDTFGCRGRNFSRPRMQMRKNMFSGKGE